MNATKWLILAAIVTAVGCGRSAAGPETPAEDEKHDWSEAMGHEHAGDSPGENAATHDVEVEGVAAEPVAYHGEVMGYLAMPEEGEPHAGVIMIHEWWGLNDNIRTMAEILAKEGYAVLAVDLYGGEVAEKPAEAQALMKAANQRPEAITANLESALAYLDEELDADSVAVMGWCFGGGQAFHAAADLGDRIDAAVVYYGHLPGEADAVEGVTAPVLGIFAAEDAGIPEESVRAFESAMDEAGKNLDLHVFPDVGHAFANPSGDRYDPAAAEAAWKLTLQFLQTEL